MISEEQIIKIKHNEFVITLEKTDLTDKDWTDITIENTQTGNCTSISKHDDDLYFNLCQLIDTDWAYFGVESEVGK